MRLWPLTSGDGHFSLFSVSDEDSRALLLHGSMLVIMQTCAQQITHTLMRVMIN